MRLEEDLLRGLGFTDWRLLKPFKSKKNQVWLLQAMHQKEGCLSIVYKQVEASDVSSEQTKLKQEADLLTGLREEGVPVPLLRGVGKACLVMDYLPGVPLCDYLQQQEELAQGEADLSAAALEALALLTAWLKGFYRAAEKVTGKPLVMKDVNLRNFLVKDGCLYGLDFEDCQEGEQEEEAGKLCAYFYTYDPAGTPWKIKAVDHLKILLREELNLNPARVETAIRDEIRSMEQRRNANYGYLR